MEKEIIKIIENKGPLTGNEIQDEIGGDPLPLWRICHLSNNIKVQTVGTRYMRLDRRIEGFARLSPSILREFLTYSVIGLPGHEKAIEVKAAETIAHIEEVSRIKCDMAYRIISSLADRIGDDYSIREQACFIIAGDIVFNMAHDVPRPERSTGKLVRGSDMDIVVVLDDHFPKSLMNRLDEEIYKEKYSYLLNPHLREEIDYIVKYIDRVREQIKFEDFKHMVACKILQEGTLLFGNEKLFHEIKCMLRDSGVMDKLRDMESGAIEFREKALQYLLKEDPEKIKQESLDLFYPTEESEEFE